MAQRFYLTKQGLRKLKKEYERLKKIRSSKLKAGIPKILHSEDVNPEYLSFKEEFNILESRLEELENIFKHAQIITPPPRDKRDVVGLGAKVVVEIDGQTDRFEIVGTLEANPILGKISNESPVGRALLGHRVGDEVCVSSPLQVIYKIKEIKYS